MGAPPNPELVRQAREEMVRRKCRRSIKVLAHYLWPILEPSRPLEWGHHHTALAKHLEMLYRGEVGDNGRVMRRLLCAVPPGTLKTTLIQIIFPLWIWLDDPTQRFLVGSLTARLAEKSARKRLAILNSELWADLAPGFELDKETYVEVSNSMTGFIQSTTPSTNVTGQHVDWFLIDDPQPANPTQKEVESVSTWYTDVLSSRTTDLRSLREVIVHQRVHARDLIGFLKDEEGLLPSDALFILQAEFDPHPDVPTSTAWGAIDWRTIPGESIHPERLPDDIIAKLKRHARKWSTQYQQSPIIGHGEYIDDRWWRFYDRLPELIDWWVGAFDTAETTEDTSDWTVGWVLAISGSRIYVVDGIKGRWSPLNVAKNMKGFRDRYPQCTRWYVEMASSGRSVREILSKAGGRMIPVKNTQPKKSRVLSASGFIEAGQVYLPDPKLNPWAQALIVEASGFPNAVHDDQIDCLSTALRQIARHVKMEVAEDVEMLLEERLVDDAAGGAPRPQPPPPPPRPKAKPRTSGRRIPRSR